MVVAHFLQCQGQVTACHLHQVESVASRNCIFLGRDPINISKGGEKNIINLQLAQSRTYELLWGLAFWQFGDSCHVGEMEGLGTHGGEWGQAGMGRLGLVQHLVVCLQHLHKALVQFFPQGFILRRATAGSIFEVLVLSEGDNERIHSCLSQVVSKATEKVSALEQYVFPTHHLPTGEKLNLI